MCRGKGIDRRAGDLKEIVLRPTIAVKGNHLSEESMGRCHSALLPAASRLFAQTRICSRLSKTCNLTSQLSHLGSIITW